MGRGHRRGGLPVGWPAEAIDVILVGRGRRFGLGGLSAWCGGIHWGVGVSWLDGGFGFGSGDVGGSIPVAACVDLF